MLELLDGGLSWFAIRVKTTHEKRVASWLDYKGYDWFLPSYRCRRRWSDRIKEVELALFPGYVFSRFDPSARLPILKTPSVLGIAGTGRTPIPIDDAEISAIRTIVGSGLPSSPHPFLQVGHRVRIQGGSLDGLEGIIQEFRQRHRLIVSVTLLQRSVAVEIDSAWVTLTRSTERQQATPPLRRSRAGDLHLPLS